MITVTEEMKQAGANILWREGLQLDQFAVEAIAESIFEAMLNAAITPDQPADMDNGVFILGA